MRYLAKQGGVRLLTMGGVGICRHTATSASPGAPPKKNGSSCSHAPTSRGW
jgi:hypothetical protein